MKAQDQATVEGKEGHIASQDPVIHPCGEQPGPAVGATAALANRWRPMSEAPIGDSILTKMKHGCIEGVWDGETCNAYYWRDMEWLPHAWMYVPDDGATASTTPETGTEKVAAQVEDEGSREELKARIASLSSALTAAEEEIKRLNGLLNTPEVADFARGVMLEAPHQRERWGSDHDVGKTSLDWFWLIGYLAQKAAFAATAGDTDKALHHTISTAAALANWHAAISGADTSMRPGITPPLEMQEA